MSHDEVPEELRWKDQRHAAFDGELEENAAVGAGADAPTNEYDALMRTAPGEEPEADLESSYFLREKLVRALDVLDERERWVFDMVYAGTSQREVARLMSVDKKTVYNILKVARAKMQKWLNDNGGLV